MSIGFTGLLTIIFVLAKLVGYISWPWVWIFAPIWISFSLVVGIFLLSVFGIVSVAIFTRKPYTPRRR